MDAPVSSPAPGAAVPVTLQFLRIALGEQRCAVRIDIVREILELAPLTPLPLTPSFVRGVMNLRGAVVPVIDLGERGTIVRAVIAYEAPAGIVGKTIAKMFQREPLIQSRRDLRRFKQLMETGEICTNARNPAMKAEQEDK